MLSSRALAITIAATVFVLDRITKMWIEAKVSPYDTIEVIPGIFNIVHTRNRGAAFGILSTASEPVRLIVLIGMAGVILGLICWMLWKATKLGAPGSALNRLSLSLVLGGAIGNLYDRILVGGVTDFLQVFLGSYEWPSFNVADSAICVGAVLMAVDLLTSSRKQSQTNHAPETH